MMNDDLISRSAMLDFFDAKAFAALGLFDGGASRKTWLEAFEAVRTAPAVDAEPVRHARLVSTGHDELYCEWADCTVCGSDNRINAKFCNNCGAKIVEVISK